MTEATDTDAPVDDPSDLVVWRAWVAIPKGDKPGVYLAGEEFVARRDDGRCRGGSALLVRRADEPADVPPAGVAEVLEHVSVHDTLDMEAGAPDFHVGGEHHGEPLVKGVTMDVDTAEAEPEPSDAAIAAGGDEHPQRPKPARRKV